MVDLDEIMRLTTFGSYQDRVMAVREYCEQHKNCVMAIPDGFVLVPIEPTVFMNNEGNSVESGFAGSPPSVKRIYKAMIAAAPKPTGNE